MREPKVTRRSPTHVRLFRAVDRALRESGAMRGVAKVAVGFSGGVDSSVLLHLLAEVAAHRGFAIVAVHVHHGLRGEAADRDADFCRDVARRMGMPFILERLAPFDRDHPPEHWLRRERHAKLSLAMRACGATRLFLGHHRDDQAETVLYRLLTGANVPGLGGMRVFRHPYTVRPMLGCTRRQIAEEAAHCQIDYREDSSNRDAHPRRNFLRNQLLPLIEAQFNPRIGEHLAHLGTTFAAVRGELDAQTQDFNDAWSAGEGRFSVAAFRAAPSLQRLHWLHRAFQAAHPRGASLRRRQLLLAERMLLSDRARGEALLPAGKLIKEGGRFRFEFSDAGSGASALIHG